MKSIILELAAVFLFVCVSVTLAVRHNSFEDYLTRERLQAEEIRRQEEERLMNAFDLKELYQGSGEESGSGMEDKADNQLVVETVESIPTTTTAPRQTEQPEEPQQPQLPQQPEQQPQPAQSACCELGARAGRNGYLCNPENYRAQIFMRNENRPNNFRLSRIDHQRYVEVRQYSKCVSGAVPRLAHDFQRCCKMAFLETLDVDTKDKHSPILLELPLQVDIANKQRKSHTNFKPHMKV